MLARYVNPHIQTQVLKLERSELRAAVCQLKTSGPGRDITSVPCPLREPLCSHRLYLTLMLARYVNPYIQTQVLKLERSELRAAVCQLMTSGPGRDITLVPCPLREPRCSHRLYLTLMLARYINPYIHTQVLKLERSELRAAVCLLITSGPGRDITLVPCPLREPLCSHRLYLTLMLARYINPLRN
ncbi:hypothetical protein J6590_070221 [Homalodisca vitripennis]|nr:hypothetical protein J6590_070221 [Homalodisca vitripennis]